MQEFSGRVTIKDVIGSNSTKYAGILDVADTILLRGKQLTMIPNYVMTNDTGLVYDMINARFIQKEVLVKQQDGVHIDGLNVITRNLSTLNVGLQTTDNLSVDSVNNNTVNDSKYILIGKNNTEGTWRIFVSSASNKLRFERYSLGVWILMAEFG